MQDANYEIEPTHVATKPGAEMDWELGGDENAGKFEGVLRLAKVEPADTAVPASGKGKMGHEEVSEGPAEKREGVRAEATVSEGDTLFDNAAAATPTQRLH